VNVAAAFGQVTGGVDYRAQPVVAATPAAVATDLPAAQAVSPAANIPPARNDSRKPDKAASGTSNVVVIDPQTDAVVFRSLDASTGIVIDQIPAQALLRQRAYLDAQAAQALVKGKDLGAAVVAAEQQVDTTT